MANKNNAPTPTPTDKVKVEARPETIVITGLSAEDDVKAGDSVTGNVLSHNIREVNGKKADTQNKVFSIIQGQMRTTTGRVIPVDLSAFNGSEYDRSVAYQAFKVIRTDDAGKVRHSYVVMPK